MITVHQIRWMSQPFMQTPGAEAPLTVEFIGPVGELCEEHIRITMEYGEITQNMLLPILVIYCSTTIAPSSKTNDNNNNNNNNNNDDDDDENYEDNTDIGSDKYSENQ